MKKRKRTERVESWRERVNGREAKDLGERLDRWMSSASLPFPSHMPVEDRAADVWEALVMVADAAGGHWPHRARNAAIAATINDDKSSVGVQLLGDLRIVFGRRQARPPSRFSTNFRIWQKRNGGTSITTASSQRPRSIEVLRPYGVRPVDVWVGGVAPRDMSRMTYETLGSGTCRPRTSARSARSARNSRRRTDRR